MKSWKEIYHNPKVQLTLDIIRVLLFVLLIVIIIIMIKEIEIVKLLGQDPCRVCMNKTGVTCFTNNILP